MTSSFSLLHVPCSGTSSSVHSRSCLPPLYQCSGCAWATSDQCAMQLFRSMLLAHAVVHLTMSLAQMNNEKMVWCRNCHLLPGLRHATVQWRSADSSSGPARAVWTGLPALDLLPSLLLCGQLDFVCSSWFRLSFCSVCCIVLLLGWHCTLLMPCNCLWARTVRC